MTRVGRQELERRLEAAGSRAPGVAFGAVWTDGEPLIRALGSADLRAGRALSSTTPFLANPIPIRWVHLAHETGPSLDALTGARVGLEPKLAAIPGTKFAYSNLGYLLLGQIIERVSGLSFEHYVEQRVLGPLGCDNSGFRVQSERATAYQRRWSLMGLAAQFMLDARYFGAATDGYRELLPFTVDGAPYGGLSGPVSDLLRLGRAMLAGGQGERGRVLTPDSVRAMLTPQKATDERSLPSGLGWHLGEVDGERFAHHLGGGAGYRAELRIYPRLGYAVAALANETSFPTEHLTRLFVR